MAPLSVRITGGVHRGRKIRSPGVAGLRPTLEIARSAVFSVLGAKTVESARVLDLYAGTGALGIEALSRNAASADFVEWNPRLAEGIRQTLSNLSLEAKGRVWQTKVGAALANLPGKYSLVFADPPYKMAEWDSLMFSLGEVELIERQGVLVVEHRYTTILAQEYGALVRTDTRRYGDTSVSFFSAGAASA